MWCNKEQLTKSQKMPIDRKGAHWMKMCLLTKKKKNCLLKNENHNYSEFLNVYMTLIYVTTCCNEKWLTKS